MLFKELLFDTLVKKSSNKMKQKLPPFKNKNKKVEKKDEKKNMKNQFCDKRKKK